ncbi:MAG: sigma-54-dependent Fis family transcriptional regulator [Xanthomonadaceae bacterium]|nr:sigma-54-dependent Fis family transcriptional regulator [Xanthomonadaceae bacterium]
MFKVLVVDDDKDLRNSVAHALSEAHYFVEWACDGEEAVTKVQAGNFKMVIMDVQMPKMTGLQALKEIKRYDPSIIVIILTAYSNVRDAIEATREGAYNYLEKPVKSENLVYMVDRALKAHTLVKNLAYSAPTIKLAGDGEFIGQSGEMKKIFGVIEKLSRVETAVLIRGESGTGKELVSQALHYNGPRKDQRFVSVNCSAIPENLIESEFFGHEKGAFTGADSRKIGKFQYADGGTLFLDEIGDITPSMQVKLLRVLQEKKFMPVGTNREIEVNVRIVAATNRNLEEMVKRDQFREDLFYRLNVLPINLPPLRERKNDIEVLIQYFIEKFNSRYSNKMKGIATDALARLKAYEWPGNIRELENVIEHSFVIETSEEIQITSLPEKLQNIDTGAIVEVEMSTHAEVPMDESGIGFKLEVQKLDFQASKEEFEKQFLIKALKAFNGRINQTAIHANIPKKTLLRKLEKYGISAKEFNFQDE